MPLLYILIGAAVSVGIVLLRYYLLERKKEPKDKKFKSFGR